ncbi:hypothetical protein ACJX0J_000756, partial (mitochondrion) [Zea mays]
MNILSHWRGDTFSFRARNLSITKNLSLMVGLIGIEMPQLDKLTYFSQFFCIPMDRRLFGKKEENHSDLRFRRNNRITCWKNIMLTHGNQTHKEVFFPSLTTLNANEWI